MIPSGHWWEWLWKQPREAFDHYFDGYTSKEAIIENFNFRPWSEVEPCPGGPLHELWEWQRKTRTQTCWVTGEQVPVGWRH